MVDAARSKIVGATRWSEGGWISVALPVGTAHVRFRASADGRIVPVELHVVDVEELTTEILRSVPLARLEAQANRPATNASDGAWRDKLSAELGMPERIDWAKSEWMLRRHSARVDVPDSHRYPDAFYAEVAAVYSRLAELGYPPGKTIAEENGQGIDTVRRWIKEARRRGHLAPGRKGRAG